PTSSNAPETEPANVPIEWISPSRSTSTDLCAAATATPPPARRSAKAPRIPNRSLRRLGFSVVSTELVVKGASSSHAGFLDLPLEVNARTPAHVPAARRRQNLRDPNA